MKKGREELEKELYKERLKIISIKGGVFPTIEDEILNFSPYTAYIPLNLSKLSSKVRTPFKLKIELSSPKHLDKGELEKVRIYVKEISNSYRGELEIKKRFRWKALKWAAAIESAFLGGLYYMNTTISPDIIGGILRFLGEFAFWGGLFFLPVTILPAIGGLRYLKTQKKLEKLEKNWKDTEVIYTIDQKVKDLKEKYDEIDNLEIYKELATYAKNKGYKLASDFYEKLSRILAEKESFITKYLPASWRRSIKQWVDVKVDEPEFFIPLGDY